MFTYVLIIKISRAECFWIINKLLKNIYILKI